MGLIRSRPIWGRSVSMTTTPVAVALPDTAREISIESDAACYAQLSGLYTSPGVATVAGVLTLATFGTPTGGSFKLRVNAGGSQEATTTALTYDESAADVDSALAALALFEAGDVTTAGGALPTAITLTFTGGVYVGMIPRLSIVESALTGGTNSSIRLRVTTNPAGNGGYGYVPADTVIVYTRTGDMRGSGGDQFLHLATISSTGTALVTAYS